MNAYAIKSPTPFVAKGELKRKAPSKEYRDRMHYIDSHDFSFSIDPETKELKCTIIPKKQE